MICVLATIVTKQEKHLDLAEFYQDAERYLILSKESNISDIPLELQPTIVSIPCQLTCYQERSIRSMKYYFLSHQLKFHLLLRDIWYS